jgi:hypothetical protein
VVLSNVDSSVSGSYVVRVTRTRNGTHAVTTSSAALLIVDEVQITSQPQGLTLFAGDNGAFQVSATAPTGATLAYQWKANTTNVGTNSNVLSLTGADVSLVGDYTVDVSATLNSVTASLTSAPAPLTVITGAPTGTTASSGLQVQVNTTALRPTYAYVLACAGPTGATGIKNASEPLVFAGLPDGTCSLDISARGPSGSPVDAPAHREWNIDASPAVVTCARPYGAYRQDEAVTMTFDRPVSSLTAFSPAGFTPTLSMDNRSASFVPTVGTFAVANNVAISFVVTAQNGQTTNATCRFDVVPSGADVIYVTATGATGGTCGLATPCELGSALTVAAASTAPVVVMNVAGGTHTWPDARLQGPLSLYGGYKQTFTERAPTTYEARLVSADATQELGPTFPVSTVHCENMPSASVIDGFMIEATTQTVASTAGLTMTTGCNLHVRRNVFYPTNPAPWTGIFIGTNDTAGITPLIRGNNFQDDAGNVRAALADAGLFSSGNYAAPSFVGNDIIFNDPTSRAGVSLSDQASASATTIEANNFYLTANTAVPQAIYLKTTASPLQIQNNTIVQDSGIGVYLRSDDATIAISGNFISTASNGSGLYVTGSGLGSHQQVQIERNRIFGKENGLWIDYQGAATIRNNLLASKDRVVWAERAGASLFFDFNTLASGGGVGIDNTGANTFLNNLLTAPTGTTGALAFDAQDGLETMIGNDLFRFDRIYRDGPATRGCADSAACTLAELNAFVSGHTGNVSADPDLPLLQGADNTLSTWNDNVFRPGAAVACEVAYGGRQQDAGITDPPANNGAIDFSARTTGPSCNGGDGLSIGAYEVP